MASSNQQTLEFNLLISQLKTLERYKGQFYWRDYPSPARWESVADHSWRLAVLVMLFAPKLSQPLDLAKAYKMALIHDIPEIIAGDASPVGETGTGSDSHAYNAVVKAQRHTNEKTAAKEIFSKLSADEANDLYQTWLEIEDQSGFEAKVVKALDRLEALMQVLEWRDGHMFPEHLEFTLKYSTKGSDVDPAIASFSAHVASQMRGRYKEFKIK